MHSLRLHALLTCPYLWTSLPQSPPAAAPAPNMAAIRTAIYAEARRRGLDESSLSDEPPPPVVDADQRLLQLIQALEGRLSILRQPQAGQVMSHAPQAGFRAVLHFPDDVIVVC